MDDKPPTPSPPGPDNPPPSADSEHLQHLQHPQHPQPLRHPQNPQHPPPPPHLKHPRPQRKCLSSGSDSDNGMRSCRCGDASTHICEYGLWSTPTMGYSLGVPSHPCPGPAPTPGHAPGPGPNSAYANGYHGAGYYANGRGGHYGFGRPAYAPYSPFESGPPAGRSTHVHAGVGASPGDRQLHRLSQARGPSPRPSSPLSLDSLYDILNALPPLPPHAETPEPYYPPPTSMDGTPGSFGVLVPDPTYDTTSQLMPPLPPQLGAPELYHPELYNPEMYNPEMYNPQLYNPPPARMSAASGPFGAPVPYSTVGTASQFQAPLPPHVGGPEEYSTPPASMATSSSFGVPATYNGFGATSQFQPLLPPHGEPPTLYNPPPADMAGASGSFHAPVPYSHFGIASQSMDYTTPQAGGGSRSQLNSHAIADASEGSRKRRASQELWGRARDEPNGSYGAWNRGGSNSKKNTNNKE